MAEEVVKRVAANVRALREVSGTTLAELARRAGVSRGALSQLEAAQANPTVETLWAIAQALGVPFSDLIAEPAPPVVTVSRVEDGEWIAGSPVSSRLLHRLTAHGVVEIHEVRVAPGTARCSAAHARGLTEHVVVHGGRLRVGPVDAPVVLAAGDAASYLADREHVYEALEPGTTGLILMAYPSPGR